MRHLPSDKTIQKYAYSECGKLYNRPYSNCKRHKGHSTDGIFQCVKGCGYTAFQKRSLNLHYNSGKCDPTRPLNHTFYCSFCEHSFATNKSKRRHEKTHIEGKPYECTICDIKFTHSWNLKKHKRKFHNQSWAGIKYLFPFSVGYLLTMIVVSAVWVCLSHNAMQTINSLLWNWYNNSKKILENIYLDTKP